MATTSTTGADGRIRGGRGVLALALLPVVGLLAACGGGGGGGGKGDVANRELIVLAATPTNSQETLDDMSDPGLEGKLTVRFTAIPRERDLLDPTNDFNQLTPNVQILDQNFSRVQGTPSLDRETNAFTFTPAGGNLDPGQYTITISKFVTTPVGNQLNLGVEDWSSSWSVGEDFYNPVIRNTSPAANQNDTPLFTPIVITFNESIDPNSAVLGQTVFVQDGGTNPPTQLNGTLQVKRDGFDLVFIPDPCAGLPPSTTVVVRLQGNHPDSLLTAPPFPPPASFIRDLVGNYLVGDNTNNYEVTYQFNTKGVKPLPNPAIVPVSLSPRISPAQLWNTVAYASTSNATYAFDIMPVYHDYSVNFTVNPALTVQVLASNQTWQLTAAGWVLTPPFGGDFETKLGKAGQAVVDWRFDTTTGHAYIFQVDEARESVAIISTGTGKVEGHFNGTGTPRGISLAGPGITGLGPTIYVANYGQGTVTAIPIGTIQPGIPICTAVKELQDDITKRLFMETGRNPTGVSLEWLGTSIIGAVVNSGDNDIQVFNPVTLKPWNTTGSQAQSRNYPVGENPIDVAWSPFIPGVGIFAYVVNQGGEEDPNGSVSLWWNQTGFNFAANTGAIMGSVTDGVKTPGLPMSDPLALSCYVPNTASDDMLRVDVSIQGGGIFSVIQPVVGNSRVIGLNPTKVTFTGQPGIFLALASLAGSGQVAVWERGSIFGPPVLYNLPGVRYVFSAWDN